MRRLELGTTLIVALAIAVAVGCGNTFRDPGFDFAASMRCNNTQIVTDADLAWTGFTLVQTGNLPGDSVQIQLTVSNIAAPTDPNPNLTLASELRLYASTDGTIDASDYLVYATTLPGMFAGKLVITNDAFEIPWTADFPQAVIPDPLNPPNIGPPTVTYNILGLIDSRNCAIEPGDGTGDGLTQAANNFDSTNTLTIDNPYLPNLQIKFVDKTPQAPIPAAGGAVITEWEILNAGIGPYDGAGTTINVYMSEDDALDPWDTFGPGTAPTEHLIGQGSFATALNGNTNAIFSLIVQLPSTMTRQNTYAGMVSSKSLFAGDFSGRDPPPTNPPTYDFTVAAPIPSTAFLIGVVDVTNTVRESVETDNRSDLGPGGHGSLASAVVNGGAVDVEPIELAAGLVNNSFASLQLRYNSSLGGSQNVSVAWYMSVNDTEQFADFFLERFWYVVDTGTGNTLNAAFTPSTMRPPLTPGPYYVIAVMDDIFTFTEISEDNNFMRSTSTVNVL